MSQVADKKIVEKLAKSLADKKTAKAWQKGMESLQEVAKEGLFDKSMEIVNTISSLFYNPAFAGIMYAIGQIAANTATDQADAINKVLEQMQDPETQETIRAISSVVGSIISTGADVFVAFSKAVNSFNDVASKTSTMAEKWNNLSNISDTLEHSVLQLNKGMDLLNQSLQTALALWTQFQENFGGTTLMFQQFNAMISPMMTYMGTFLNQMDRFEGFIRNISDLVANMKMENLTTALHLLPNNNSGDEVL